MYFTLTLVAISLNHKDKKTSAAFTGRKLDSFLEVRENLHTCKNLFTERAEYRVHPHLYNPSTFLR